MEESLQVAHQLWSTSSLIRLQKLLQKEQLAKQLASQHLSHAKDLEAENSNLRDTITDLKVSKLSTYLSVNLISNYFCIAEAAGG